MDERMLISLYEYQRELAENRVRKKRKEEGYLL